MHFDRDTKIAFLGMGLMGTRMATRLVQAGFEVAVWNRSPAACEPVLSLGAKAAAIERDRAISSDLELPCR